MATNNPRLITLAIIFLLWLSPVLSAQSVGYFIHVENDEPRFFQRLAWTSSENAKRYELILEKEEDSGYQIIERRFTTDLSQFFTLTQGKYRFRVIPYDVLDRPGGGSEWTDFEVLPALQPEIDSAFFDPAWLGDYLECVLKISGKDMVQGATMFIRDSRKREEININHINVTYYDSGSVWLYFDGDKLLPGKYELFIENPGGLKTSQNEIVYVIPEKPPPPSPPPVEVTEPMELPFSITIGVSLMPSILIYSQDYKGKDYFAIDSNFSAFAARIGLVPTTPESVKIGIETMASYSIYSDGSLLAIGAGLLAQKWKPDKRTILGFRLGLGYIIPPPEYYGCFQVYMGTSLLWRIRDHGFFEMGIGYEHLLVEFTPGLLRPWIGFGAIF